MDLRKMSDEAAQALIKQIYNVLDNEKERDQIQYAPNFLHVLRKQNCALTEGLDQKVEEYFPNYYKNTYKLETTKNEEQELPVFVQEYTERIRKRNEEQGKNGKFLGYATREIATVRAILVGQEIEYDPETIDELISVVADTILFSKESFFPYCCPASPWAAIRKAHIRSKTCFSCVVHDSEN